MDCVPIRSPHIPRTTSTTKAWRWKYSKLFSRLHWTPTEPSFQTTREHPVFDLGDALDIETTTMFILEVQTTELIQVLPLAWTETSTMFSLEEVIENCSANRIVFTDALAVEKFTCSGIESSSIEI